jgi:Pyruvate/2-oxoacid:ferredoxin oxidoreductase delta subunit
VIDARTLAYDWDEEAHGFPEPPKVARRRPLGRRLAAALIVLGGLAALAPAVGFPLGGPWTGFLLAFGPLLVGTVAWSWSRARGRPPGIDHDGIAFSGLKSRGRLGWTVGVLFTAFYVVLYWFPGPLDGAIGLVDPLARVLSGGPADRWFLYGFLYTAAVLAFGARMILKYRHNRYQIVRTISVSFFQLGLAFLLPNLLKALHQPDFYFTYFWPLKPDYLLPFDYVTGENGIAGTTWSGLSVGRFMLLWGALMTFVATPVLTWFFGKRWYCSWVCGCGGLAETLGDPWRQLSDKSTRAWKIERWSVHGVLVAVVAITAFLWINEASGRRLLGDDGSTLFWRTYGFVIVLAFAGVVGVGFYPVLGSRVWCRFGCPMAAILGLFQRFLSRFRITTNGGQCMSCGNCSAYCEMGIDVRAYAEKGENIVRASCVGCGVCSAVCPRGVLRLENGASFAGRYEGSEAPLRAFAKALRGPTIP